MTETEGGYGPLRTGGPDLADALSILHRSFGLPWEDAERYADLYGVGAFRALRRNGTIAATAAVWDMDQWFGGRPVPARAVALVAVDPVRRGCGHGRALLRAILEEARADGAALSVLHHATLPFYAKAGFGRAGTTISWSAPPATLAAVPPPGDGTITRIPLSDAAPLAALRRPLLATANGLPERTEALWTLTLASDGASADIYRLDGPDGPEGYIAVAPLQGRTLTVVDCAVTTGRAARLALRFLAGHRAQVDRVRWRGGPQDPFALLAGDGVRIDAREEWLTRVVNIEAALAARGYPAGVDGDLRLQVRDPWFPRTDSCVHLTVDGGKADAKTAEYFDHKENRCGLTLDVSSFSTLFSGHAAPELLRQVGLLEGDDTAIATAARLFSGPSPWMPDRF